MSVGVEASTLLMQEAPDQAPPLIHSKPVQGNNISNNVSQSIDILTNVSAMTVSIPPLTPPASVSPSNGASSNLSGQDCQRSPLAKVIQSSKTTTSLVRDPPILSSPDVIRRISVDIQQAPAAGVTPNTNSVEDRLSSSDISRPSSTPPNTTGSTISTETVVAIAKSRKLGAYSPTRTKAPSLVATSTRTMVTVSSSVTTVASASTSTRTNTVPSSIASNTAPGNVASNSCSQEDEEDAEDIDSKRGIFGWETIDGKNIPTIFRNKKPHVSVRMVEEKMLKNFPSSFPDKLKNLPPLNSFYITDAERKLLNEINVEHCNFEFGHVPFTSMDVVVRLEDFKKFYEHVKQNCEQRSTAGPLSTPTVQFHGEKTRPPPSQNAIPTEAQNTGRLFPVRPGVHIPGQPSQSRTPANPGGWIQLNNTITPFIFRGITKLLPLDVVRISAGLNMSQSLAENAASEEVDYLNKLCKSTSIPFEFQKPMKLVNIQFVTSFCLPRITELPITNPLQHAKYIPPEQLKQPAPQLTQAVQQTQPAPQTWAQTSVHRHSAPAQPSLSHNQNSRMPAPLQRPNVRPTVTQPRQVSTNGANRLPNGQMRPSLPMQRPPIQRPVNQTRLSNLLVRPQSSVSNRLSSPRVVHQNLNTIRQTMSQNQRSPIQQHQRTTLQMPVQRAPLQHQQQFLHQSHQRQPSQMVSNASLNLQRDFSSEQASQHAHQMNISTLGQQNPRMQMVRTRPDLEQMPQPRYMPPQRSLHPRLPMQTQAVRIGQPPVRYQQVDFQTSQPPQLQRFSSAPANRPLLPQQNVAPNTALRHTLSSTQSPDRPQLVSVQLRSSTGSDIVDLTRERLANSASPQLCLQLNDNVKYSLKFMPCYGEVVLTLDIEGYGEYCNIDELAKKYFVNLDCAELTYALVNVLRVPLLRCSEQFKYDLLHNFDMRVTPQLLALNTFKKYLPKLKDMFECTEKVISALEDGLSLPPTPNVGQKRTLPPTAEEMSKRARNGVSDIICLD